MDLDNFFTDIHKYLRFLEEVVILTLKEYGLDAERSKGETGVWVDVGTEKARKIAQSLILAMSGGNDVNAIKRASDGESVSHRDCDKS